MRKELHIFFTALMFYTRIPCPKWVGHDPEYLNKATRYLPFIGWIVGGLSATTFLLADAFFTSITALLLSLGVSVLTTGAFHEDGFADVCDGFGGGWTKEKILTIMKDSRVGTYGAVGLLILFGLKLSLLHELLSDGEMDRLGILLLFVSAHAWSRFSATLFIATDEYVREDALSKAKPVAKEVSHSWLMVAFCFALMPLAYWAYHAGNFYLLLLPIPLFVAKYFLGRYFRKWIGGYTGDCLGATQQVTEVCFYMATALLWNFI